VDTGLFGSELWRPALDKYAEATGLTVELFEAGGNVILRPAKLTPLVALFREYGFEPGLFGDCASRCVRQTIDRPAVAVMESNGLTVVGTSLLLEGEIVGAAVAGYALAQFSQVPTVQRWAKAAGVPFERLWDIVRRQPPLPERRLMLHGELLQVLGDALLRENYRTRQYEDAVAKLEAASAAKDEFLAVVSHELRTPLAPIAGWASVIKNASDLAQARRAAEAIERNAFLQSRMVDDLLDLTRIRHGSIDLDLEILELEAVIRAALELYTDAIEKKSLQLELDAPGEPLAVDGDASRLQQVFRNILSNAVKYTPPGGKLRIALSREADQALVRVADTGKGIDPDFLPFAFDVFRQQQQGTHRSSEGLGIGLSLVKRLTELHKGSVSIASPGAGGGTEVTVRLPLAAKAGALDAPPSPAKSATLALAGLSVLVIEDSEDARESIRALLEMLGAKVSVARDGREGLEVLLQGAAPDVVLCDLLMPRLDGFELMRDLALARLPARPPVIAMSGLGSETSRERTLGAGFAGHIKKPFSEATVVLAVHAALGRQPQPLAEHTRLENPR
jgi:signal transduction histidine kinase/ActR/RegA family two-component response regulator